MNDLGRQLADAQREIKTLHEDLAAMEHHNTVARRLHSGLLKQRLRFVQNKDAQIAHLRALLAPFSGRLENTDLDLGGQEEFCRRHEEPGAGPQTLREQQLPNPMQDQNERPEQTFEKHGMRSDQIVLLLPESSAQRVLIDSLAEKPGWSEEYLMMDATDGHNTSKLPQAEEMQKDRDTVLGLQEHLPDGPAVRTSVDSVLDTPLAVDSSFDRDVDSTVRPNTSSLNHQDSTSITSLTPGQHLPSSQTAEASDGGTLTFTLHAIPTHIRPVF